MKRRLKTPNRRKYFFKAWLRAFFTALGIVIFLALFTTRFFFVQGTSMTLTLLPGDYVYVDKLSYGARLPTHPIALPYSSRYYSDILEIPYTRVPGLFGIDRSDILAFNHPFIKVDDPIDKRPVIMKRCVGLPGDTISIRNGYVFVNQKDFKEPSGIKRHFHLKVSHDNSPSHLFDSLHITKAGRISNQGDWLIAVTEEQAGSLKELDDVLFVNKWNEKGEPQKETFPHHPTIYPWNFRNLGPLWIPKQGASVELDTSNIHLYKRIISVYEDHELSVKDSTIRIDGEIKDHYTFEMDYFFLLGDDRPNSKDSRAWGFIPEELVLGKASFILFSHGSKRQGSGSIRWNRTFQGL